MHNDAWRKGEWDRLTPPQQKLLRSLGRSTFGIEVNGKWIGTARALRRRELATGTRVFVTITDRGKKVLEAVHD
jgi:hypothetical protein